MTGHVSALNTFAYGSYLIAGTCTTETRFVHMLIVGPCPEKKPKKNYKFCNILARYVGFDPGTCTATLRCMGNLYSLKSVVQWT